MSMSLINSKAGSGSALPGDRHIRKCPKCDSGLCERAAPHQALDLSDPAFSQELQTRGELLKSAKRSRSPQGRGTASIAEVRDALKQFCT